MACEEVVHSKPLFLTIYTIVIVGIVFSSLYVFSAIRYPSTNPSSWSLSNEDVGLTEQTLNGSGSETVHVVPSVSAEARNVRTRPLLDVPPRNTKMPSLKAFRLTKELVQQRVKDNIIIVTFGNYAFMDFIMTWVQQLNDMGVSNYLVGAMDTKLLEALYWKGVPVFDMGSHMSTADVGWGSPTFHKMGREKVILINMILPFGFELLMCDTDMVWLKNPLPYLARYPGADVLTSSDQVVPTVVDDSLEIWQEVGAAYNFGIFHWRPTESAKKLAKEWKELLLADEKIWDQNGFNDIVHRQLGPSVDEDSGLVYAYDGNLKLGILPSSIFCSGHTYFVQAMYQQLRLEPYAVHTTFQYGGTEGKRHRLREAMVFRDPPEYYNPPGGFLSFKPSIPKSLLLSGKHTIESHFTLVNYQIKQIRTALAVASLLNRTLVGDGNSVSFWNDVWISQLGKLIQWAMRSILDFEESFKISDIVQRTGGWNLYLCLERSYPTNVKSCHGLLGLELALARGYKKIYVESDSQTAVKLLNHGCPIQHYCYSLVSAIRHFISTGCAVRCVHILWEINGLADSIANHFRTFDIPHLISASLLADATGSWSVVPPLWCRIDRLWFPHPGVLEGSMTRQPFLCPLDHVFEVNVMLKQLPEEEFGPGIDIREYSILDNPSLPSEVKNSWLDVHLCKEGTQDCLASSNTTVEGVLKFPRHSTEETYMKVFSSFKDVKVIQFSSMQDAFTGFMDKERQDRFRKRVQRYVGIWCCVMDHTPGHIYYDMYWDEKPEWKPIPPQTSADDHPPW